MRFEAKHSHFKDLAHRIKNFKNIPKSLAHRYQAWSCYVNSSAGHGLFKDFSTGPGMGRKHNYLAVSSTKVRMTSFFDFS